MVRAIEEEQGIDTTEMGYFKEINGNAGRRIRTFSLILDNRSNSRRIRTRSLVLDDSSNVSMSLHEDERLMSRKQASAAPDNQDTEKHQNVKSRLPKKQPSDMELMKERFAKLLLGEDMSGGGKGVSSALALSNAITNLAASVFGEQKRLEPMSLDRKARWKKEIDWLLSVTDHIVEFVPSKQKSKDGTNMEIMVTRQRNDLLMSIPALRKLDAMLIECLENFKDQKEFYYVSRDEEAQRGAANRNEDKWWIPTPKVPPNGLSDATKKWLQVQKDSVNQVHKAAMAINAQVLTEMGIPESYIESLPKNGRVCLGDTIYRSITAEEFDPHEFLSTMDLLSDHKILDLKNKIEASVVIWKRKMNAKEGKSAWSSGVSMEKRELFEERAETILLLLKHYYPGIPQSQLDISKIQFSRDVGHAILESYSRAIETLAFTVLSRIEDVLHADSVARNPSSAEEKRFPPKELSTPIGSENSPNAKEEEEGEEEEEDNDDDDEKEGEKLNSSDGRTSMTLLDFMGWDLDQADTDAKKECKEEVSQDADLKLLKKPPNIPTNKRMSYLETLGGSRSPTARH